MKANMNMNEPCQTKGCQLCLGHPGRHKFKDSAREEKVENAKWDLAHRFADEIFSHKDLCATHHFSEVLAIALAHHLKNIARYSDLEDMDYELAKFVRLFSILVEPDPLEKDDADLDYKVRVSIQIDRKNN